jgi:hypothetical protein
VRIGHLCANGLDRDREHFVILAMDIQNQVRGFRLVATGG